MFEPSLGFVGDICLSMDVINTVRRQGADFLFEEVRRSFDGLDLVIGNLESCITNEGPAEPPLRPPLSTPTDVARALHFSGISILNLANNHVMDFGVGGLRFTLDYLDRNGSRHFGAGMTMQQAEAPLHVEISGRRVAFLGACDVTACWASDGRPGVAPLSERRLLRRVAEARETADLVVVILHADLEFVIHPAPWRQRLSRRLIRRGAGLVIQHHPHVYQGIERYMGGLIAYSLGNHVFQVHGNEYQEGCPGTAQSVLLQVDLEGTGGAPILNSTAHPLQIDRQHRPIPCDTAAAERWHRDHQQLGEQLLDPRAVRAAWRRTCRQQVSDSILGGYYTLRKKGIAAAVRQQFEILRAAENRRWIYGFLSAGFR
jgi:Bacterial capsule synthesis protein PGA_cap